MKKKKAKGSKVRNVGIEEAKRKKKRVRNARNEKQKMKKEGKRNDDDSITLKRTCFICTRLRGCNQISDKVLFNSTKVFFGERNVEFSKTNLNIFITFN